MKKQADKNWVAMLATVALFVATLCVLLVGTFNLSGDADDQGLETTQQAIERATVLCYASEGFYPPGLSYLETRYGVQIDRSRYSVRYEVFASNVMPSIRVIERK